MATGHVLDGRYRLDDQIGAKGLVGVFLATDLRLGRRVVVELLDAEATREAGLLPRLEDEVRRLAALDHGNLLPFLDYGEAGGAAWLVRPYVEGVSLHRRLSQAGSLDTWEAGDYLRQVAAALDYVHGRGIAHGALHPRVLLLRAADGRLLLAGLGLARILRSARPPWQPDEALLPYSAPERLLGAVSPEGDIYALGCVLCELLTGAPPYAGPGERVVHGHILAPTPALAERGPAELPAALDGVLARALAKRPAERFPTAGDLARAFEAAVAGQTASAPQTTPAIPAPPRDEPGERRATKRGRVVVTIAGGLSSLAARRPGAGAAARRVGLLLAQAVLVLLVLAVGLVAAAWWAGTPAEREPTIGMQTPLAGSPTPAAQAPQRPAPTASPTPTLQVPPGLASPGRGGVAIGPTSSARPSAPIVSPSPTTLPPTPSPTASPSPEPPLPLVVVPAVVVLPAPSPAPTPTHTPALTPEPTLAPTPTTGFPATDRVGTTVPVNLRAGPGVSYPVLTAVSPGTLLSATGETRMAGGVLWRRFRLPDGRAGWIRDLDTFPVLR